MREQFAKLSDKFASLNLECQVDKGNFRAQLEQLGYNIALLTTKLPTDSFPSHKDSSTSGIKSGESSRKVVYNQNAVNHLPQPPFPGLPGSNLWMSPDGGMVAIPPNGGGSGNPPRPPMPMWGMGGMGRGTGMP